MKRSSFFILILVTMLIALFSSCNNPQQPHDHTFGDVWNTSSPATVLEEGEKYRECTVDGCDHKEYETISRVEVAEISIEKQPDKTVYTVGDKFDPAGMKVIAIGVDGSSADVSASVTFKSTELDSSDSVITISYGEKSSTVNITVVKAYSVSEALEEGNEGDVILVEGLFVGVSDEGAGFYKELLLKDTNSDKLIAVQGVTYGSYPYYGYEKGDLVRIYGELIRERYDPSNTKSENKTYLQFADANPAIINSTIVSKGNKVTYDFSEVVEITSWDDMKKVFNAATLEAYTYIHIKGDVWFNTYAKASDGVVLHRFCMTSSGTSLSKMKPDGVRAVGFRQNTLEANAPMAMTTYFDEVFGSTSYPGNKANLDFYAVLTATNSVNFQLTILENDWMKKEYEEISIKSQWDIVKEIGFAFYRQGTQILYDQRYRNENPSPEDASRQNQLYLDCSSFVNAVYYEAFGVNILGVPLEDKTCQTGNYAAYAKENNGKSVDVIGYWETDDYKTDAEQTALLAEVYSMLQVGDILNYRHGKSGPTSGHALLYIGDGMFLHSTGAQATFDSANPSNNEDIANVMELTHGTVQKIAASKLFTSKSSSRYLFRNDSSDKMYNFCIIRPLNKGLTATEKTQARMELAGLSIEKNVQPGISAAVAHGCEITYTLVIENHSINAYSDILFEDILSDQLIFVSGTEGITVDGQKICMKVSVGAMETVTIKWVAKVKEDAKAGADIESCNTSFGGIEIFDTVNFVASYTNDQLASVAEKALEYAQSNSTTNYSPLEFAGVIYKEALGADIFDITDVSKFMDSLFKSRGEGLYDFNEAGKNADMAVPFLYSGTAVHRLCDISQIHRESDLALGDLIFCQWKQNYRLYIYVGDGRFVMVDTITNTPYIVQNGKEIFQFVNNKYCLNSVTSQLRTYERCIVIRPSMRDNG